MIHDNACCQALRLLLCQAKALALVRGTCVLLALPGSWRWGSRSQEALVLSWCKELRPRGAAQQQQRCR